MSAERDVLEKSVDRILSGKNIHVDPKSLLEGLDWQLAGARPGDAPHSVYQLLGHIAFWQDWALEWLDGEEPPLPEHASDSWPGGDGPASAEEWQEAVERFRRGLDGMLRRARQQDLLSKRGDESRLELLSALAAHNSYHLGQVVLLRQMLGSWPPPGGGLTW